MARLRQNSMLFKQVVLVVCCFVFPGVLVSSITAQETTPAKQSDQTYLQACFQIANWLQSVKITNKDGTCTWPNDPDRSKRSTLDLYHGDAGVVLFYLKLHQATRDKAHLAEAEQGARGLIAAIDKAPKKIQPGLFTGYSGYGWVLLNLWQETQNEIYRKSVLKCVKMLEQAKIKKTSGVHFNGVTDVISGSAGVGMFLVDVYNEFGEAGALQLAMEIGDGLIADAVEGADPKHRDGKAKGLRWKVSSTFAREYPNYSHGTAGNADFLVRLHQAVVKHSKKQGKKIDDRFLKAATRGAEYLESVAKIENDTCLIFHDTDNGDKLYYLGWCHGPAGTGNFFWNLYQATDQKRYQKLTMQNAHAIVAAQLHKKRTAGFWNNTGQCCGSAGVAEFIFKMYRRTKEQRYLDECKRLSKDIIERATVVKLDDGKKGLKWIHAENRVDPKGLKAQTGYMQGAAGIGCWLLNMHAAIQK